VHRRVYKSVAKKSDQWATARATVSQQVSADADGPARRSASHQTDYRAEHKAGR